MIKYKTCFYNCDIEAVEVERESDKSVWLKRTWNGVSSEKIYKEAKHSMHYDFHDTFGAAKNHLRSREEQNLLAYEENIKRTKALIEKIKGMKQP